jgi:NAD(P)-dependent dehydrogenase (short-subunit alcohol dehydrogenase family)
MTNIGTSVAAEQMSEFGMSRAAGLQASRTRRAEADEIAQIAVFLASDAASNINGAVIVADGGWTAG